MMYDYEDESECYCDEDGPCGVCCERFADPGGTSALHAEGDDNPRNLPCPTCKRPDMLTPRDRARGYQCDRCADAAERGYDY